MPLGKEVGISPGHIVLDGDPVGTQPPTADVVDRGRWKKLIKIGWWSGWWVGEFFFWYRLTRVVPDRGP